jgi:hypothetical protein
LSGGDNMNKEVKKKIIENLLKTIDKKLNK